jgi:hypothetical protein
MSKKCSGNPFADTQTRIQGKEFDAKAFDRQAYERESDAGRLIWNAIVHGPAAAGGNLSDLRAEVEAAMSMVAEAAVLRVRAELTRKGKL